MGIDQKGLAEAVGRAIARQRIRCRLTQEDVAERLGIGNEAVSRIERESPYRMSSGLWILLQSLAVRLLTC